MQKRDSEMVGPFMGSAQIEPVERPVVPNQDWQSAVFVPTVQNLMVGGATYLIVHVGGYGVVYGELHAFLPDTVLYVASVVSGTLAFAGLCFIRFSWDEVVGLVRYAAETYAARRNANEVGDLYEDLELANDAVETLERTKIRLEQKVNILEHRIEKMTGYSQEGEGDLPAESMPESAEDDRILIDNGWADVAASELDQILTAEERHIDAVTGRPSLTQEYEQDVALAIELLGHYKLHNSLSRDNARMNSGIEKQDWITARDFLMDCGAVEAKGRGYKLIVPLATAHTLVEQYADERAEQQKNDKFVAP